MKFREVFADLLEEEIDDDIKPYYEKCVRKNLKTLKDAQTLIIDVKKVLESRDVKVR